jgi:hypothetical protein
LLAAPGSAEHRQLRFWMHYAEGSLMNWLVMKLVFMTIPRQPMPFFVRPIARKLCATVQAKLIDPNLKSAMEFIEDHLAKNTWFAGERLTLADFQMSFAVAALLSRADAAGAMPAHRGLAQARRGPPGLAARHRQGRPGADVGLRLLPSGAAPSPGRNSAAIVTDRSPGRKVGAGTTATPAPTKEKARRCRAFSWGGITIRLRSFPRSW